MGWKFYKYGKFFNCTRTSVISHSSLNLKARELKLSKQTPNINAKRAYASQQASARFT